MKHLWAPVGTGVRPQAETDFVVAYLFGDSEGLKTAKLMNEKINSFPGFEGIDLYQSSVHESIERLGSPIGERPKPYTRNRSGKSPNAKKVSEVR